MEAVGFAIALGYLQSWIAVAKEGFLQEVRVARVLPPLLWRWLIRKPPVVSPADVGLAGASMGTGGAAAVMTLDLPSRVARLERELQRIEAVAIPEKVGELRAEIKREISRVRSELDGVRSLGTAEHKNQAIAAVFFIIGLSLSVWANIAGAPPP
jgi:hypothetical protein